MLEERALVGIGVRGSHGLPTVELLGADGQRITAGTLMRESLAKGTYWVLATTPNEAPPQWIHAAIVGSKRPVDGPPDAVVKRFLVNARSATR